MHESRSIVYTVSCRFVRGDAVLATNWLDWLTTGHIQEVLDCGALSAEVALVDDSVPHYEIRCRFEDRRSLATYLNDHAPRLRAVGLAKFPLEKGLVFSRWTGEVVSNFP